MAGSIIRSILDTDLYKLSMQKAVLAYQQGIIVQYIFSNRRKEGKFNMNFLNALKEQIELMSTLTMDDNQCVWLQEKYGWLGEDYIQYLKNYRFDPNEVSVKLVDNELEMEINGTWERTILWEVPLMALISELYFIHCEKDWVMDFDHQIKQIQNKGMALGEIKYTDFGTRRRRNFDTQFLINQALLNKEKFPGYVGTSNVHIANLLNVKAVGTMAHEWIMGISALEGLKHANKHALKIWSKVYNGNLGTALTDTFGSDAFFKDFDGVLARLFDSVRHDSGDPLVFVEKTINAYKKLGINPMTKSIIFSDGLDVQTALEINKAVKNRINDSYGIGTNFTNDFGKSKPLNMVIKLLMCNGVHVVKLSDTPSKAIGDKDAVRVAKWTFFDQPLDS